VAVKRLITSALPYANGPLHFGHLAGALLPADCYARFCKLQGEDVCFICGDDEYGVAITLAAELAGRSPQEHVDLYHQQHVWALDQLAIRFTHFSRTTWEGHRETVDQFFLDLLERGHIEPITTDQLYSESEGKFLADRYVVGTCPKCHYDQARGDECPKCSAAYEAVDLIEPRSKLTNSPLVRRPTKHWFIRLDQFRESLLEWISKKNWKPNVVNFAKRYIEDLRPRAITRDSTWGVPVPLKEAHDKVVYVWFEAVIGYISASKEWSQKIGDPERWKRYWCDPETRFVQFLGKDNIPFHAVLFPAMTMGQSQPYKLVDELAANEHLNLEGRQFSKSDNWFIDLEDFLTRYTADQLRYALAANAPETSDSEFTWADFQQRCNAELLGKYGNLVNRTLVFAQRFCNGEVPHEAVDEAFVEQLRALANRMAQEYGSHRLRTAAHTLMEIAATGNGYFDAQQPWKAAKQEDGKQLVGRTIASCLECLKILAIVSSPLIPTAAQAIWQLLGQEGLVEEQNWNEALKEPLPAGRSLPPPQVLFRKIESEEIEAEVQRLRK
jgi:methionyl-tRNA synthetase